MALAKERSETAAPRRGQGFCGGAFQVAICIYTYMGPYKVQAFTQILYMYSCWDTSVRPNLAYLFRRRLSLCAQM